MGTTDIRTMAHIRHEDIVGLNFIRSDVPFVFRPHRRQGLRSHVLEVLDPMAVKSESHGQRHGGLKWFPRAIPLRILRIFRIPLHHLDQVRDETARLRIMERYLGSDHMALSQEFVVSYRMGKKHVLLLCGLQEFVEGQDLDPWQRPAVQDPLVAAGCRSLVDRIQAMVAQKGLIPDLAGAGNLLVTPSGAVKLVDINNSSRAVSGNDIPLDDKGYPVWDKSVEALWRIECFWAGRKPDMGRPWYRICLDCRRRQKVNAIEARFKACLGGNR